MFNMLFKLHLTSNTDAELDITESDMRHLLSVFRVVFCKFDLYTS